MALDFLKLTSDVTSSSITTIDKLIIERFNNLFDGNGWGNFLLMVLSLILTVVLVGIIGYQREKQGHNAGFRTHILVGIGSAIIMILSIYSIGYTNDKFETMRLAASVAPGIGFLGAGVIIKTKTSIKGLTTAATLWVSMAIGLACGSGNFVIALLSALTTYLCIFFFYKFEIIANKNCPKLLVYLYKDQAITFEDIINVIDVYNFNIRNSYMKEININNKEITLITIEFSNCYKEPLELMCRDLKIKLNPYEVSYECKRKDIKKEPD